jgi:hypothetical protein
MLNCIKITPENFRLDMLQALGSPFNIEAIKVFTMDFLEKVKRDKWYQSYLIPSQCLTVSEVLEAICQHLKHIFSVYKQSSQLNMELNQQAQKEHLTKASRSTRKGLVRYPLIFDVSYY